VEGEYSKLEETRNHSFSLSILQNRITIGIMAKILIIDDDVRVTALYENYLSMEGYEITSVNDSSKAVQTALSTNPDLFILDLMMPEPNGFKLCRLLRTFPNFINTPILIVTALDDGDSQAVAFGAGADDYLAKPFHMDELSRRIKDLLTKTK